MFGLKGRDVFNKPSSNIDESIEFIHKWWSKLSPYILAVLILTVLGVLIYIWHVNLHNIDVSNEERSQYILKKNKEVEFKKEKFDEVKNTIILKSEKFNEERVEYYDIFYGKMVETKNTESEDSVEL